MSRLHLSVLPSDWPLANDPSLPKSICVVIDVIRATSTIVAALAAGVDSVQPIRTLEDAYALKERDPDALLAGERQGLALPGFDLGNSPQRFTPERVRGRRLLLTTTNGTSALLACQGARAIVTASLLNLSAVVDYLLKIGPPWRVVCAGRGGRFALDDALVAGLIAERLDEPSPYRALYRSVQHDIPAALRASKSGAGLVAIGLGADVDYCGQIDLFDFVPKLTPDGLLRV